MFIHSKPFSNYSNEMLYCDSKVNLRKIEITHVVYIRVCKGKEVFVRHV